MDGQTTFVQFSVSTHLQCTRTTRHPSERDGAHVADGEHHYHDKDPQKIGMPSLQRKVVISYSQLQDFKAPAKKCDAT